MTTGCAGGRSGRSSSGIPYTMATSCTGRRRGRMSPDILPKATASQTSIAMDTSPNKNTTSCVSGDSTQNPPYGISNVCIGGRTRNTHESNYIQSFRTCWRGQVEDEEEEEDDYDDPFDEDDDDVFTETPESTLGSLRVGAVHNRALLRLKQLEAPASRPSSTSTCSADEPPRRTSLHIALADPASRGIYPASTTRPEFIYQPKNDEQSNSTLDARQRSSILIQISAPTDQLSPPNSPEVGKFPRTLDIIEDDNWNMNQLYEGHVDNNNVLDTGETESKVVMRSKRPRTVHFDQEDIVLDPGIVQIELPERFASKSPQHRGVRMNGDLSAEVTGVNTEIAGVNQGCEPVSPVSSTAEVNGEIVVTTVGDMMKAAPPADTERVKDLDVAIQWLRQQMAFIKQQDKVLLRQFLDLRATIHSLRYDGSRPRTVSCCSSEILDLELGSGSDRPQRGPQPTAAASAWFPGHSLAGVPVPSGEWAQRQTLAPYGSSHGGSTHSISAASEPSPSPVSSNPSTPRAIVKRPVPRNGFGTDVFDYHPRTVSMHVTRDVLPVNNNSTTFREYI